MEIKAAIVQDIPSILDLLECYFKVSEQRKMYDFDRSVLCNSLMNWIQLDNNLMIVCKEDDIVVGFFTAFYQCNYYSKDNVANMEILYVKKQYRSLKLTNRIMKRFIEWCKIHNCRNIEMLIDSGIKHEKFDIYLKRQGFKNIGNLYNMEIQNG